MTAEALARAFHTYFEEFDRCLTMECYWALVHILMVFPDICSALEADDGESKGWRYRCWCERYLSCDKWSPDDRYALRCALLHEGSTLTDEGKYGSYSLLPPNETSEGFHLTVDEQSVGGKPNLSLHVADMVGDMKEAFRRWCADLERPENTPRSANVQRHLPRLARRGPKDIKGRRTYTISSTGDELSL